MQCPLKWTRVFLEDDCGTCLRKFDQNKTWLDARDVCRAEGGDIADITEFIMIETVMGE